LTIHVLVDEFVMHPMSSLPWIWVKFVLSQLFLCFSLF